MSAMKAWHMFLRAILFPLGKLLFPCKVMDKDKYKKFDRGQIIISNHLAWMDVCYAYFGLPGYKRVLSKKENMGNKLQSAFMGSVGVIFVDRDKPELSSMRKCLDALKAGETLYICPEGTRNKVDRSLQKMHSGAALFAIKGNARVVPYVVHHKGKVFRCNYLGVGDPVDLSDLFDKRADSSTLEEATERFRAAMQATLDKLDVWVETKGYKRERAMARKRKRENKLREKELNKQYKLAKKQYDKDNRSK